MRPRGTNEASQRTLTTAAECSPFFGAPITHIVNMHETTQYNSGTESTRTDMHETGRKLFHFPSKYLSRLQHAFYMSLKTSTEIAFNAVGTLFLMSLTS
jgi:hypothetical protein